MALLSFLFVRESFIAFNAHAVQTPQKAGFAAGDWPMYLADTGRSGYNSTETAINPTTASNLKLHWQYRSGGNISTQPVVVNGMIYWGSWDGYEHATNLKGIQVWKTNLGINSVPSGCHPPEAGVASIAADDSVSINGIMTTVVLWVGAPTFML